MGYRNAHLDEAMRSEGRGKAREDSICHGCYLREATVHCDDCFGSELFCQTCCVSRHASSPLHRIKVCDYLEISLPRNLTTTRSGTARISSQHGFEISAYVSSWERPTSRAITACMAAKFTRILLSYTPTASTASALTTVAAASTLILTSSMYTSSCCELHGIQPLCCGLKRVRHSS